MKFKYLLLIFAFTIVLADAAPGILKRHWSPIWKRDADAEAIPAIIEKHGPNGEVLWADDPSVLW
ncbi:uncharacterized protein OCT59_009346 [Rhizophagus irregularis]|uniref:Uncharacterized protein n=1 Tax=Rhizophagus irregularis (strain DAOM 181602 / DAOM 197198 / MUCL 43194) TaxID=747089 RepID=A0A2P4Q3W5_RHIID|nr:hypothetical protein GLOIN_2v1598071 [Rhizophagus irregularis DAOM 181602=DAOM 197198]POG72272.1 hypothetical protein GLOIN_2v1598071 [Rhizophagus irregularis DAOM 181602=DAOM 197198]UZO18021.1 hypothetical protein OCT59_009346 [Rhizophagus irregularis]CAG8667074.1 1203_t:CDS:2 [Rhizophagus irregularis]|eukprot:XP_025179138.1 hypothetical protein GLOIN_2v1598071 [Rhizophagus irregularis DAOM 181602=DAOM 197198]